MGDVLVLLLCTQLYRCVGAAVLAEKDAACTCQQRSKEKVALEYLEGTWIVSEEGLAKTSSRDWELPIVVQHSRFVIVPPRATVCTRPMYFSNQYNHG